MSDNPFEGIQNLPQTKTETIRTEEKKKENTPKKSSGLASRGKPISPEQYPKNNTPHWENAPTNDYQELNDFTDLSDVNQKLNRLRSRFYHINTQLKQVQRQLAQAKAEYSSNLRRQLVDISGGTEKTRVAMAEIACEEWESEVVIYTQLVQELTNDQRIISKDLEVLETLSNNIRAQMKIM